MKMDIWEKLYDAARKEYEGAQTPEEKREILTRINQYTKELKNLSAGGKL